MHAKCLAHSWHIAPVNKDWLKGKINVGVLTKDLIKYHIFTYAFGTCYCI